MDRAPDTRSELLSLDRSKSGILRGVAILLVLLGHTGLVRMGGAGGVALFLLLSGYGLNSSCEQRGLGEFWQRRLRKVWLPYLFVGVLDVLVLKPRGAGAVLCTLLGLDLGLHADATMWYISYIFFWYLAYWLLARLVAGVAALRRRRILLTAGLFLACALCLLLCRLGFWHAGSLAKAYIACFPLGVLMSCCREYRTAKTLRSCFWTAVGLGCAAYLCLPLLGIMDLTYLTALSMAGLAVAAVQLTQPRGLAEKLLGGVGEYAYALYLFEGLFLPTWRSWTAQGVPLWAADLSFFAVTAGAAVLYWKLYRAIEKRLSLCYNRHKNDTEKTS